MYTVASPNHNECNSMLTSAARGEMLTPKPNECNSTLTSGTRGILPLPLYIDVDERGHRLRVIPFFNRTGHTEEYVVKPYPSDFLFHLHPTDLPMEEHISTRDPQIFKKLSQILLQ